MRGNDVAIWVDEFDFSSVTSQVEMTIEVGEAERTSLASSAQEFLPLLAKATVMQNGYFHGVLPTGFERELRDRFGAGGAIVTVLVGVSQSVCVGYVLPDAANYNMTFGAPATNIVTLNGQWGSSMSAVRGLRVFDGVFDAVESGASVDFGAGTTSGGTAYLHVATITGTATNATIVVQSSADNSAWNDEGTFTLSAVGGYSVTLSGVVGRYVRLSCSSLGGASAIRCMAVVSLT